MADDIASIFHVAPQQPPNLLGMIGQFATTQNALNQAKLFEQEFAARKALGPLAQQSVDPTTGQMNWSKFMLNVSTHPDTAFKAPEIITSIVQRQLTDAQTAKVTLENETLWRNVVGDAAAALVAKGKDGLSHRDTSGAPVPGAVSQGDVLQMASRLLGQFPGKKDQIMSLIMNLPRNANGQYDPRGTFDSMGQFALQTQGSAKTLETTYKQVNDNLRGVIQHGQVNPYSNTYTPTRGGQLAEQPTSAERGALERIKSPTTGETEFKPRQVIAPMPSGSGAPAMGTPGAAAVGTPSPGSAAMPASGGPRAAPQETQTSPPAVPLPTPAQLAYPKAIAELSPVQQKALEKFPEYMGEVNDDARNAQNSNLIIDELRSATRQFKTGGGTSGFVAVAKLLQTMGATDKWVDKVAQGNLGAAQEFDKLALQMATTAMRLSLGPGASRQSQLEFKTFVNSNPNLETDPRAVEKVFNFMARMNGLALARQHLLSEAYTRIHAGEKIEGLSDITQFEPWFNKQLNSRGVVRGEKGSK